MNDDQIHTPEEWEHLSINSWQGTVLIVGANDTGKSTFGQHLYQQLLKFDRSAAYIDADLGQQFIGPPASIGLALSREPNIGPNNDSSSGPDNGPSNGSDNNSRGGPDNDSSSGERRWFRFVGNNTPRGHFLPLLLGLHRLQEFALDQGASTVVINTSGFINPMQGAAVLKWAKVELLKPSQIVAFQRERELEPILAPLRRLIGDRLHVLPPSDAARSRSAEERRSNRSQLYKLYFNDAQLVGLSYKHLAVFPHLTFQVGQLISLEDGSGFSLALGVIDRVEIDEQAIWIKTPWWGKGKVTSLQLGAIKIDLDTYLDEPL